jgi:hypothetical protein
MERTVLTASQGRELSDLIVGSEIVPDGGEHQLKRTPNVRIISVTATSLRARP